LELAFMEAADLEATSDNPGKHPTPSVVESETERSTEAEDPNPTVSRNLNATASRDPDPMSGRDLHPTTRRNLDPSLEPAEPVSDTGTGDVLSQATGDEGGPPDDRAPRQRSRDLRPSGSGFQAVLNAWPDLLAKAFQRDPRAQALLNSCKPLGVNEGALVLGFQSDLLRDKMEKGHNLELVTDALSEVLGSPLEVRCVLLDDWGDDAGMPPPMKEGGMVATAIRDLGAQIVDHETDPGDSDIASSGAELDERDGSEGDK
jgi:DNA polymerase-3 subunit gamma/tau